MNHQQRLVVCEQCSNKEFSPKKGIVCSLTSERPAFERSCGDFEQDPKMQARSRRAAESRQNLIDMDGGGDWASEKERSPWKIIVGVIVVILVLLRVLMRCDRMMN